MSIPFTFIEETHTYQVEGHYVLSTSDVRELAGLATYEGVPQRLLDHAAWRGSSLDDCIRFFEAGDLVMDSVPEEVMPYFRGYLRFRSERNFEPLSIQKAIVYEHEGTGQLIGCTLDLRGIVDIKPYIVDTKCTYPYSGAAKKQHHLNWRMQLQSQHEATMVDESFWADAVSEGPIGKAILHLKKDSTYDFVDFSACDDMMNWDACVRMAMLRLANGWKRSGK